MSTYQTAYEHDSERLRQKQEQREQAVIAAREKQRAKERETDLKARMEYKERTAAKRHAP
jgi:hypothetical protein